MKILLIRPPYTFWGDAEVPKIDLPTGLLYIAPILEQSGYEVELIDGVMLEGEEFLKGKKDFLKSSWELLKERIQKSDSPVAAISCLYSVQFPNAQKLARMIKKVNPEIRILVGGPHVSSMYKELLQSNPDFDILVRGEGEYAVKEVLDALFSNHDLSSIKGIAFRKDGKIIITKDRETISDLDSLPLPAYHLIDIKKYFLFTKKYPTRTRYIYPGSERGLTLITSRGCPYNCIFCSVHLHMGRKWRAHSAEYVLNHMEFLIKEYNVKYFHFEDDNLTLSIDRFRRILDGIIERKWEITWDTPNGVRIDTLDRNLLERVRDSGCTFVNVGIESGVQRVLDEVIHKRLRLEQIERVASIAQQVGVHLRAFYMIGFPGETRQEIRDTVDFALRMNSRYDLPGGMAFTVPLYGTEVYRICQEKEYFTKELTPEGIAAGYTKNGLIRTEEFDPEYLSRMLRLYWRKARWLKLKKFLIYTLSDFKLLRYLIKKLIENPKEWRHYISEIVFWRHLLC